MVQRHPVGVIQMPEQSQRPEAVLDQIICSLSPTHLGAKALCCLKKVAFSPTFFPIKCISLSPYLFFFLVLHFLDTLNTKQ